MRSRQATESALHRWKALVYPVLLKVIRDIQELYILEPHLTQREKRRPDVWTILPGTASAIDDNFFRACDRFGLRLQKRKSYRIGCRSREDRIRDVSVFV